MARSMTFAATVACLVATSQAFVVSPSARATTALSASRRDFLVAGIAGVVGTAMASPAEASYSAYTAREKDWEARNAKGEVTYKTARDLRAELRDIVPQNSEGSKIFCPNGPSAAVSPLMENKCGDAMATVSVFGRTEDTVGNSIPGFKGGKYPGQFEGGSTTLTSNPNIGGFPSY